MDIVITAAQLRVALDFVNPDGTEYEDQMETEVTLHFREKDEVSEDGEPLPRGLYCYLTEHPEEGCIPLFDLEGQLAVEEIRRRKIEEQFATPNAPHEGRAAGFSAERPFDAVVGRHGFQERT